MYLKQKKYLKSGKHSFFKILFILKNKKYFKRLALKYKSIAGRDQSTGGRILSSKNSLSISNTRLIINYSPFFKNLAFINAYSLLRIKNKILSLLITSSGSFTYVTRTSNHELLNFFSLTRSDGLEKFQKLSNFLYIGQVPRLSKICLFSPTGGEKVKFARSPGASAKLLFKDSKSLTAVVRLPSKSRKVLSFSSIVSFGEVFSFFKKKYICSKAGYWRVRGYNSNVRGVAKNPVDHPHGGRTKAIRWQRTPWDKSTKIRPLRKK